MTAVIFGAIKLLFFEMHAKSVANAIAAFISVGGVFLWNIILDFSYHNNVEYDVNDAFLERFGRQGTWWLTLLLSLCTLSVIEVIFRVFKAAYFPSDTDVFQGLEKDPEMRKKFEEAARLELHQGWEESDMLQDGEADEGTLMSLEDRQKQEAEQLRRENEVEEMLKLRGQGHTVEISQQPTSPGWSSESPTQEDGERSRRARRLRGFWHRG